MSVVPPDFGPAIDRLDDEGFGLQSDRVGQEGAGRFQRGTEKCDGPAGLICDLVIDVPKRRARRDDGRHGVAFLDLDDTTLGAAVDVLRHRVLPDENSRNDHECEASEHGILR